METERSRVIERIYHAARGRRTVERETILADACQGDEELRREVEALLARDDDPTEEATRTIPGPGSRIGPYEIEAGIGKGGMGQVFRARDTRLGRVVAIKTFHERFPLRFEREARAIAQLNHFNICTLYDIGPDYLVMECIEGRTLKERLAEGALGLDETLDIVVQVAQALRVAHQRGVFHRDIKPANIMVTRDGIVKIMDFGLAKLIGSETEVTMPGTVIGTPAYMSPEQASGKPAEHQSDIWSLGVVMYEMLSGQLPFRGETSIAVLRAILDDAPQPLSSLRPGIPSGVDRVVQKALAKDLSERYQKIEDLIADLAPLRENSSHFVRPRSRRLLFYAAAAMAVVLVAVAAIFFWRSNRISPSTPLAMEQITAFPDSATNPALSADGRMLTFIRGPGTFTTSGQIYVKLLPSGQPIELTHDGEVKMHPVFSPDGSQIAYTVLSSTQSWDSWVVPVVGGQPRIWLPNASGLSWIGPQQLLFSEIKTGLHMAIITAGENRTAPRDIYAPPDVRGMAHRSYRSPDKSWVLLSEMDRGSFLPCRVVPFDGSSMGRVVGPNQGKCTSAAWSPDGKWVYVSSNATGSFQIWRQRFPDGQPEQITFGPAEAEGIVVAPDGRSLITSLGFNQRAVWLHENGAERQVSSEGTTMFPQWGDGFPRSVFSPDGKKLYYFVQKGPQRGFGGGDLWVSDLATGASESLLPGLAMTTFDLSPDGRQFVFAAVDSEGKSRIWIAPVNRRSAARMLPPAEALGPVFGSENEIYFRGREGDQWFVFELKLDSGQARKFIPEPTVNAPVVSYDGQWIVSRAPLQGQENSGVVRAYPRNGGAPIVVCQGCYLSWTRDGKSLFFSFRGANFTGAAKTWVITLAPGKSFPVLPPEGLNTEADLQRYRSRASLNARWVFQA